MIGTLKKVISSVAQPLFDPTMVNNSYLHISCSFFCAQHKNLHQQSDTRALDGLPKWTFSNYNTKTFFVVNIATMFQIDREQNESVTDL